MFKKQKPDLHGKICLVTGASRGIGKGIAVQLAKFGAVVYITGRTLESSDTSKGSLNQTEKEIKDQGGDCKAIQCDHSKDEDVKKLFEVIKKEQNGRLDVLVNNAFSAFTTISASFGQPYWKQPISMWDEVNNVGLRNHYVCTVLASQLMVERGSGLIVNISSAGGLKYALNVPYGIGKAALDRMASDCAVEVGKHGVCVVSLWPGAVRTENIAELFALPTDSTSPPDGDAKSDQKNKNPQDTDDVVAAQKDTLKTLYKLGSESAEYTGLAVSYLASDKNIMKKNGKVLLVSDMAAHYGFKDVDGSSPYSYRSIGTLLGYQGVKLGNYIPSFVKIPRWGLHMASNKF